VPTVWSLQVWNGTEFLHAKNGSGTGRKKMAYKMYVRPWPLTSVCKQHFYMYKRKNFRYFVILSKFSAVNPSNFYGEQNLMCFTVVENFVNFGL